jgi:uncharacterized Zn-binding protein involved in type VI secretion
MPATSRRTDINSHGGTIVGAVIESVIVEGQACAVIGSTLTPDSLCPPLAGPHCGPVVVAGSGSVNAGGIPVTRIGDANNCGASNATGAGTVITGG